MADDDNGKYDDWQFSQAEFTPRERRRVRKLIRDDDNASYLHRVILKWSAVIGGIIATVVAMKDSIKAFLKWMFAA